MENKIIISENTFKVLSVEDTIKIYAPNLSDTDIKAFVWYNRTLGIPMNGFEKWFINSEKKVITAKENIVMLNQQYEPIGEIQGGDEVGKVTRFENDYKGVTYVAVRRFDNSLCLIDKSKINLDDSKYEVKKQELDELVKSFSLMYIDGMYLPLHVYTNTDYDILKRNLDADKDYIIKNYGSDVYEYHKNIISGFTTMQVNHPIKANRFKLNPFGEISRDVKIVDEDGREQSITQSFLDWTRSLKSSDFELVSKDVFRDRIIWNSNNRGRFSDLDKDEKEEANKREKADADLECERLFSEYLTNIIDSDTQKIINKRINETYNQSLKINTTKIPVGFVCSNKFKKAIFRLTPVQVEAFKFAISRNNFCLALTVGFGKTGLGISIISYLLTTSTIKKPIIVVPKPVLKNWQKEMFGYWSNGKSFSFVEVDGWDFYYGILTHCGFDFSIINNLSKKYKKDAEKIQYKQKSITLASYEALEKMYIGDEDVRFFVIDVWKNLLEQSFDKQETEKESAKKISTLIAKLNKVDKDAEVDIMKLGFDSIYFDEAHRLKNLFSGVSADKTNRISSGFKGNPSNRSLRAFYLTQYLQKIKGRVGFLTATPFSNSPLEVYTMLVFLNFSELVKNNVFKIKNFVEIFFNETLEYKVNQSNKIVSESVMKNYKNKPILFKILSNTFIYKDDPKLAGIKRPCLITYPNKQIPLMLSQSPLQVLQRDALTDKLKDLDYYINQYPEIEPYADDFLFQFKSGSVTETKLGLKGKILMASKSSALSPFAQSPFMMDFKTDEQWRELYEFSPKIKFCVDAIKYIIDFHNSRSEKVSSFLIYMEFGVNIIPQVKECLENICGLKKGLSFSLTDEDDDDDDIKGNKVYYDEVEVIEGSADNEKEANRRERVSQLFNKGLVKVIIGTSTIKEGLNLQENSATEFILTPSWNSTDISQVIGRIHRQGNRFPIVRAIMPVVARTLDSFIFQKYEEKKSRLNDVWQDNEVSTTEADDVNISADKQKELILNDANEIAEIRIDMLRKKEINEYNKIKDEYDSLESAISKSDKYKYFTNFFSERLGGMLSLCEGNLLALRILLDYCKSGKAESFILRKKDRIEVLVDYYIDLIETIKKANETKYSTDIINIFKGNFRRRDYHLSFEYYDEQNFKDLCRVLKIQNSENLLQEDLFRLIGVSKNTKYTYSSDNSYESVYDFIQINADCLNAEKFILNPEGVSLSSNIDELQKVLQKYQQRITDKVASINENFDIQENYRGFDLKPKENLKEKLILQAKIELDGENKLAQLGDKLASYFAQKTNIQLTYTSNEINTDNCNIPFEDIEVDTLKLESIQLDEIPKSFNNYKKLYDALIKVVNVKKIDVGFYEKVGKDGEAFMPLSVEAQILYKGEDIIGKKGYRLIMEQNYVQNGDLMTDPRIDFAIYNDEEIAIPINYENNGMGIYAEYIQDGKILDSKNLNSTIKFCVDVWFKNLKDQDRTILVEEKLKDKELRKEVKSATIDTINTIGDKLFIDNPSKIIGEFSISDFRNMILVKGDKKDVINYFEKELGFNELEKQSNQKINEYLEKNKEQPNVSKVGFTESKDLNKIFGELKNKYGEKKGTAIYEAANRLVNPNENTIVEIRGNGVVVKEGDKYILKPFGNTDANSKKWTLYKGLDITDQFAKSEQPNVSESNPALSDVESTTKQIVGESAFDKLKKEGYTIERGKFDSDAYASFFGLHTGVLATEFENAGLRLVKPSKKIKVYRGTGKNVAEGENEAMIWVAEDSREAEKREVTTDEIVARLKQSKNEYFYIQTQNFDEYQIWYGSNVFSLYSKKKNQKSFHKESISSGGVLALIEYIESKQKEIFGSNLLRNGINNCGFRKSSNDEWVGYYLSIEKIEVPFPDDDIEDEYTNVSEVEQSTEESEYLTDKDEIKEALIDLASRAYSGDEFIELLVSLAISFKIDINSKNTKEVLGIYGISDTKLAQKKAKAFYNKYGLAKRNERKKEARETAANIAVENITKIDYELDYKEEKQKILDTIKGLEV